MLEAPSPILSSLYFGLPPPGLPIHIQRLEIQVRDVRRKRRYGREARLDLVDKIDGVVLAHFGVLRISRVFRIDTPVLEEHVARDEVGRGRTARHAPVPAASQDDARRHDELAAIFHIVVARRDDDVAPGIRREESVRLEHFLDGALCVQVIVLDEVDELGAIALRIIAAEKHARALAGIVERDKDGLEARAARELPRETPQKRRPQERLDTLHRRGVGVVVEHVEPDRKARVVAYRKLRAPHERIEAAEKELRFGHVDIALLVRARTAAKHDVEMQRKQSIKEWV